MGGSARAELGHMGIGQLGHFWFPELRVNDTTRRLEQGAIGVIASGCCNPWCTHRHYIYIFRCRSQEEWTAFQQRVSEAGSIQAMSTNLFRRP